MVWETIVLLSTAVDRYLPGPVVMPYGGSAVLYLQLTGLNQRGISPSGFNRFLTR